MAIDPTTRTAALIMEAYEAYENEPGVSSPSALDLVLIAEGVTGVTAHAMVREELGDGVFDRLENGDDPEVIAAYLVGILTEDEPAR